MGRVELEIVEAAERLEEEIARLRVESWWYEPFYCVQLTTDAIMRLPWAVRMCLFGGGWRARHGLKRHGGRRERALAARR